METTFLSLWPQQITQEADAAHTGQHSASLKQDDRGGQDISFTTGRRNKRIQKLDLANNRLESP